MRLPGSTLALAASPDFQKIYLRYQPVRDRDAQSTSDRRAKVYDGTSNRAHGCCCDALNQRSHLWIT